MNGLPLNINVGKSKWKNGWRIYKMNVKISRNDPCPCGSGKKYKKCCGRKEAVSIMDIIESEMDDLQKQILQFAFNYYGTEMEDDFEDLQEMLFIPDEKSDQYYEFIHSIWFSLFEQMDDGETIIEKFVAYEGPKVKRPKLKQILQSWVNPRVIAGKVISAEKNKLMVEDAFTLEKIEALIINDHFPAEEGSFFVGMLLPYDQNYVFFPGPFQLQEISVEQASDFIKNSSLDAGYDLPQEYLTDFFIEVMNELPMVGQGVDLDSIDWPAPIYQEVVEIFQRKFESVDKSDLLVEIGIDLWYQFCQKKKKRIQNPSIYAAAIHYLVATIMPMSIAHTQKELGDLYGVSANSISTAFNGIEYVLSDEITDLLKSVYDTPSQVQFNHQQGPMATERAMKEAIAEIQGQNFDSIEEINQFLNQKLNGPKKVPQANKQSAQDLIYDAFEVVGNQRYKLAEQALKLDPNCVDAYVILAEKATSLDEALTWYEKGMRIGEKKLGKAFFVENKGHFWGLIETRPFMRAKLDYAMALYDLGEKNQATKQYEELLVLNPNDNQGVRYLLFIAYVDLGQLKKTHQLLSKYDERTAQGLYNKVLLELLENGFTPRATKLFKEAKKQNKYVISYLTGKKTLPAHQPDYYGFGDDNEAIIYVNEHLHLWMKINGIHEWIKEQGN
jgi:tetratricopeptide (TPR) repeat protein